MYVSEEIHFKATECLIQKRSALFSATFILVFMCLTTVIFGTLNDGSLPINNYDSTMVSATKTSSKMTSKSIDVFVKKLKILYNYFQPYNFI